jgi:hypothetical protein
LSEFVRRHFSVLCMLAAWLCANGAALEVMQAYAWTRMFAGYARTCDLALAVSETFNPGKLCPLCKAVQKEREAGGKQQATATVERATILFCQRSDLVLARPLKREWPELSPVFAAAWRQPVPLPPPKFRLA